MLNKKEMLAIVLLFLLAFFLFTWNIGSTPILDGDTAFSATIAKNILISNNWITLKFIDPNEIICKPPLFYWMMAAGGKLFGINEFGMSILHSLIGALTVLLTYFIARALFNQKVAFWSALVLLSSAQFFYQGRSPLQDIPLTFFIAAALYCFILFEKRKNYLFYYLIPVFAALATLTKGPVGLVLVGLVLMLYVIYNKKLLKYLNLHLLGALMIFLLVAAPWFIAGYQIQGPAFARIFLTSNVGRFFMPIDQTGTNLSAPIHPQYDFYTLPLMLLIVFVPWSGFLYPAIFAKLKEEKFLISWIVGVVVFFSLSLNYKIGRYILPAYPALAILIAKFLCDAADQAEKLPEKLKWPLLISKWLTIGLILPLLILTAIYFALIFPAEQSAYQPIVLPTLSTLIAGMLLMSIFLLKNQIGRAMAAAAAFAILAYLILIPSLNHYFPEANPAKQLCLKVNQMAHPTDEIVLYNSPAAIPFAAYYLDRSFTTQNNPTALRQKLAGKHKVIVLYLDARGQAAINSAHLKYNLVSNQNGFMLFSNQ
ncbi:MAG: glycosyltransferase family 39 protein [Candidatus Margulisiibacteriota bacterium]